MHCYTNYTCYLKFQLNRKLESGSNLTSKNIIYYIVGDKRSKANKIVLKLQIKFKSTIMYSNPSLFITDANIHM